VIKYGPKSRAQLDTLHPTLARVLYDYADLAPPELDLSVVCGHRGEAEQNKAFAEGKSKLRWPFSGHNKQPARAVDICPYIGGKLEWNDRNEFLLRQGALRLVAAQRGVRLKPLIDWDLPHLELADPE
jgi:peptidoglycan LD-endopeptidase CwlK